MKTEIALRDITIRMMIVLVWFEGLWAAVFLVGLVFQWSGLTDQLSTAFFGSGFCAALLLAALALLNLAVNLNIISKSRAPTVTDAAPTSTSRKGFVRTLAVAGGLIALVVGSLWIAEWRLFETKSAEVQAKLESVADSPLTSRAISIIQSDGTAHDLGEIRDAISASILSGGRLSLVYPRLVENVPVYYEFTAWWNGGSDTAQLSDAPLNKFVPMPQEHAPFDEMRAGKLPAFVSANGQTLRAFRRVDINNSHVVLLIDTSRKSEYSRSRY